MSFSRILLIVALFAFVSLASAGDCDCSTYTCGCCLDGIPVIHSVCANVTWNAEEESITVELEADNEEIIDQTFTDDSPLDVCASLNPVCKIVCLDVQNLNITDQGACGQLIFNATCFGIQVGPFSLGDFYLGDHCIIPVDDEFVPSFTKAIESIEEKAEEVAEEVTEAVTKAIAEKIPAAIGKVAARIEAAAAARLRRI